MVKTESGTVEPTIAIVGSGPSGCYTAQFLRKRWPAAEIVIIDRLDHPYGLVNYGVALDHPGTKAVAKQFDRLFDRDGVRFAGNIEIGTDITLEELRAAFDIVVLATGLHGDRTLDVPGHQLAGVLGSGRLTRLINGHPDEDADGLTLGSRVSIVGHGNVAIDLVRLMLKSAEELRGLGVADDVITAITKGPVQHIDVVGRSLPALAKFDPAMVRELAKTPDVRFLSDHQPEATGEDTGGAAKLAALATLLDGSPAQASRTVAFHFGWAPSAVTGINAVEGITFRSTDGGESSLELATDTVCTAIGFTEKETAVLRRADHESGEADLATGLLGRGLYCVGWLRRGPRGTIPENRADSKMVADTIADAVDSGELLLSKPGVESLSSKIITDTPATAITTEAESALASAEHTTAGTVSQAAPGKIVILFGTESGNAEMVAEELAADVESQRAAVVHDMTDFPVTDMTADEFYVIVCSTHGDGELPAGARPFLAGLETLRPNLSGVRYAMFGLGDSSYDTYSQGSEHIDNELTELGARRVGVYGRHDASDGTLPNADALAWVRQLYEHFHYPYPPLAPAGEIATGTADLPVGIERLPEPELGLQQAPAAANGAAGVCPFPAAAGAVPIGDDAHAPALSPAAAAAVAARAAADAAAAFARVAEQYATAANGSPATSDVHDVQQLSDPAGSIAAPQLSALRSLTVYYDPLSYAAYDHPYDLYRQLRDYAPVYYNERRNLYVVSRHADVQAGLKNHAQMINGLGNDMDGTHNSYGKGNLVAQDPPRHTALRQAVRRTFAAQEILAKEDGLREFARGLLADLRAKGGGDFASEFALPLAIGAATNLIGAPSSDNQMFQEHLLRSMERTIGQFGLPSDAELSNGESEEHLAELVHHRVADIEAGAPTGGSDAITQIILNAQKGKVEQDEQVGLAHLVISAAIDAPAALLTNCVAVLDKYPALQGYLAQERSMIKPFVEEVLRYDTPGQNLCRQTISEVTIAGVTIPNDSRVMLLQASANRDERVFENPDTFDISRVITAKNKIMSFGEGIHACMGAPLARLATQVAMETLLDGTELRIVGMPERWVKQMVRGFSKLPVTFMT